MLKKIISNPLSLIVVAIGLVASFLVCISNNTNGYVYESKTIKNKENALCVMYETLPGSGVYEEINYGNTPWAFNGFIFNDDISGCKNGSELSWNQDNNQVIVKSDTKEQCYVYFDILTAKHLSYSNPGSTECTDVECALDELFTIFVGEMTTLYWNDNFANNYYAPNEVPSGTGLSGTYESREQLASAYSNWNNSPLYVKTTKFGNRIDSHKICIWYNSRELCIENNYWYSSGPVTAYKLQTDISHYLGVTVGSSDCVTSNTYVYCNIGNIRCTVYSSGNSYCDAGGNECYIHGDGRVDCGLS